MRVIIMSMRTVSKRKRKDNQHGTVGEQGKGGREGSKAGAEKQSSRREGKVGRLLLGRKARTEGRGGDAART
jgi:hypothetical protein